MAQWHKYVELSHQAENSGDLKQALEWQLKFIDSFKPQEDEDWIFLAKNYVRLSNLLFKNGYLPKAILFLEKALDIQHKYLPDHDLTIAGTLLLLVRSYLANFYIDKALEAALKAVEILQKHPSQRSSLALLYSYLAIIYQNLEQLDKAEFYAIQALKTTSGQNSIQYAEALINLSNIYFETGRVSRACELVRKAIDILKAQDLTGKNLLEQAVSMLKTCSN